MVAVAVSFKNSLRVRTLVFTPYPFTLLTLSIMDSLNLLNQATCIIFSWSIKYHYEQGSL
jgi:hypothetical protein